jgi:NAD-dependent deacetylase
MLTDTLAQQIDRAAELIRCARNAYAFTGAGISTDSGIPDFRSQGSGMWAKSDPMVVASLYGFMRDPSLFYNWVRDLAVHIRDAKPNAAHMALAALEKKKLLRGVITQNIDMLHTRAGSSTVYELHGHLRQATCMQCFAEFDGVPIMNDFLESGAVPYCPDCGGAIKPNVVLFGEQLPHRALFQAQEAARQADLLLIVGSSLEVAPASDIPMLARRNGTRLIVINLDPTHIDVMAHVTIHERAAAVLPRIVERLESLA